MFCYLDSNSTLINHIMLPTLCKHHADAKYSPWAWGLQIHEHMMEKLPPVPELPLTNGTGDAGETEELGDDTEEAEEEEDDEVEEIPMGEEVARDAVVENVHEVHVNANAGPIAVSFSAGFRLATRAPPAAVVAAAADTVGATEQAQQQAQAADVLPVQQAVVGSGGGQVRPRAQQPPSDMGLTIVAIALTIAILALFIKKMMKSSGVPDHPPLPQH